jgi:hypothetical protein
MNKTIVLPWALMSLLLCSSCHDDDLLSTHWMEPTLQDSWKLELMPGVGRPGSSVMAYKDKLYDGLFTRNRGWNGGDGVLTVGLPNGDVLWTFNDSFYGVVGANRMRGQCNFPRNSIMVQKAHNGVLGETSQDFVWLADYVNWTDSTADRYFQCRTHLRHPQGEKTPAEIQAGDIDQTMVYWSGDGTVYNGKLQLLWMGTQSQQLQTVGTALAIYSLTGNEPQGYYLKDIPDYLPHEGDYLYRESVNHNLNDHTVSFGSTLCEADDGHTYLYASVNNYTTVVARTETHDLSSKWSYYMKDATTGQWSWQDTYPTDEQLSSSGIVKGGFLGSMPWVFKDNDYYYMTMQGAYFSRDVYIYRSKTPYGPFTDQRFLFTLPSTLDKLGDTSYYQLYMVNLHPALSREGELVFSTNTSTENFWNNFNNDGSADFYRPYFYRIYNWKSVYDE